MLTTFVKSESAHEACVQAWRGTSSTFDQTGEFFPTLNQLDQHGVIPDMITKLQVETHGPLYVAPVLRFQRGCDTKTRLDLPLTKKYNQPECLVRLQYVLDWCHAENPLYTCLCTDYTLSIVCSQPVYVNWSGAYLNESALCKLYARSFSLSVVGPNMFLKYKPHQLYLARHKATPLPRDPVQLVASQLVPSQHVPGQLVASQLVPSHSKPESPVDPPNACAVEDTIH